MTDHQDQLDTPGLPPPSLNLHHQQHGPGPELNNSAEIMELQRIPVASLLNSHAVLNNNNNNNPPRTSEPDNDDCCAQPEQLLLRALRADESLSMREGNDTSTILSYRTGTDTMDTDTTIQRGSRSKKPSPDSDVQPLPAVHRIQLAQAARSCTIPGAIIGPQHHESTTSRRCDMPSSLSFPSPPSVDDDEEEMVPTQPSKGCGGGASSVVSGVGHLSESLSASSNRDHQEHANKPSDKWESSSKKRFYMVLIALVVLVIVIVVSLKATSSKKKDGPNKAPPHDNKHPPPPPPLQSTTGLVPSSAPLIDILLEPTAAPTLEDEPAPQEPLQTSDIPALEELVTLQTVHGGNQTQPTSDAPSIAPIPAEEVETTSPSLNITQSSAPSTTPSLRKR